MERKKCGCDCGCVAGAAARYSHRLFGRLSYVRQHRMISSSLLWPSFFLFGFEDKLHWTEERTKKCYFTQCVTLKRSQNTKCVCVFASHHIIFILEHVQSSYIDKRRWEREREILHSFSFYPFRFNSNMCYSDYATFQKSSIFAFFFLKVQRF